MPLTLYFFILLSLLLLQAPHWVPEYDAFGILLSICNLGVGLNFKQRERQGTNGFSCKLHLLTPEPINTLYHNTQYHKFEDKTVEKNWSKTL